MFKFLTEVCMPKQIWGLFDFISLIGHNSKTKVADIMSLSKNILFFLM